MLKFENQQFISSAHSPRLRGDAGRQWGEKNNKLTLSEK
jgi:hypothetical protein